MVKALSPTNIILSIIEKKHWKNFKLILLLCSDCINWINDFHNNCVLTAIVNVSSFLFSVIDFLICRALDTIRDVVVVFGFIF